MLPLIAGIAIGAAAVVAVNNRKEIKKKVAQGATIVKEKADDLKNCVVEKVEKVKTKELKFVDKEVSNVE